MLKNYQANSKVLARILHVLEPIAQASDLRNRVTAKNWSSLVNITISEIPCDITKIYLLSFVQNEG